MNNPIRYAVIDVGVLVNLSASGSIVQILGASYDKIIIPTDVWVNIIIDGQKEVIAVSKIEASEMFTYESNKVEYIDNYIQILLEINSDYDAMHGAIAIGLEADLITDNSLLATAVHKIEPRTILVSTAYIAHAFAENHALDTNSVSTMLKRISRDACFSPNSKDQHRSWWLNMIGENGCDEG